MTNWPESVAEYEKTGSTDFQWAGVYTNGTNVSLVPKAWADAAIRDLKAMLLNQEALTAANVGLQDEAERLNSDRLSAWAEVAEAWATARAEKRRADKAEAERDATKEACCHGCYTDWLKVIDLRKELKKAEAEVERLKTLLYGNGEDDRGLSGMYYEKWAEVERLKAIPTTEKVGGVTSCAACGAVVDIEYDTEDEQQDTCLFHTENSAENCPPGHDCAECEHENEPFSESAHKEDMRNQKNGT